MPRRRIGQLGLMDAAVSRRRRSAGSEVLDRVSGLVDWAAIEALLPVRGLSARGEAAYPSLMLFKALLLQRWHNLSDPGLEAALSDRLSFARFCGLSLDDETPDHATLWRFRDRLAREGRMEALLAEIERQLSASGALVKTGTLIDATLVMSAARRPTMEEPKRSPVDPDADFGTGNESKRFSFGFKAHAAVDSETGLVRRAVLTPASVQEVKVAPALLPDEAGTVYGDKGYAAGHLRAHLAGRGYGDGLMQKANKDKPLSPEAQERNHAISKVRRRVEKLFGTMKRSYGLRRFRAFSLARNAADFFLFCLAFNLRRWAVLQPG